MSKTSKHLNPANEANALKTLNKKPYHTPQLQDYGTVSELTLTSAVADPAGDGGQTLPNVYASS